MRYILATFACGLVSGLTTEEEAPVWHGFDVYWTVYYPEPREICFTSPNNMIQISWGGRDGKSFINNQPAKLDDSPYGRLWNDEGDFDIYEIFAGIGLESTAGDAKPQGFTEGLCPEEVA